MADILIRDLPDDVVAAIDNRAQRAGLSRTEYLRRALARERSDPAAEVDGGRPGALLGDVRRSRRRRGDEPRLDVTTWLIDKSALTRLALSPDAAEWAARIQRGFVRISTVTRLEVGHSARSGEELRAGLRPAAARLDAGGVPDAAIEDRAVAVQAALADRGQHRAPSIPDLLIAATAEVAQLTVLHVDKDYELIAELTTQPVERLRLT